MKESYKDAIFFVVIFVTFFILVQGSLIVSRATKSSFIVSSAMAGIIQALLMLGLFYLLKLNKPSSVDGYKLLDIAPYKMCTGGAYMHQGNSPKAQFCQKYMNSPCGQKDLAKYVCPTGDIGVQRKPFEYSPLSDSDWKNERCDKWGGNVSPLGTF